jgi:hypothetical protein
VLGSMETKETPLLLKHVIPGGVECEFKSLSGTRYRTLSGFSEDTPNLDLRHEFERVSNPTKVN